MWSFPVSLAANLVFNCVGLSKRISILFDMHSMCQSCWKEPLFGFCGQGVWSVGFGVGASCTYGTRGRGVRLTPCPCGVDFDIFCPLTEPHVVQFFEH